jgi:hypothetical protein
MWSFLKQMGKAMKPVHPRRRGATSKAQLTLEALEDRQLMATQIIGGVLTITTGNMFDRVSLDIGQNPVTGGSEYVVRQQEGNGPIIESRHAKNPNNITRVSINTGQGHDVIHLSPTDDDQPDKRWQWRRD